MGVAMNVDEGREAILKHKPDLVFLDVQIHDKTGFDLLLSLPGIDFEVIFTTAHDKYAVNAFKFSALDFLLKPVDADDLALALRKLSSRQSQKEINEKFDVLFHNLRSVKQKDQRICVPMINGLVFFNVSDIIRCKSDVNYTHIYLKDGQKMMVSKTLKEFDDMLAEFNFFRVHNSHLINLNYIRQYNKGKGGYVTMTDGSEIEVSTRRKEDFMRALEAVKV